MAVERDHAALLQCNACKHHVCSRNHLALEQRVERLEFHLAPDLVADFACDPFVSHAARLKLQWLADSLLSFGCDFLARLVLLHSDPRNPYVDSVDALQLARRTAQRYHFTIGPGEHYEAAFLSFGNRGGPWRREPGKSQCRGLATHLPDLHLPAHRLRRAG